MNRDTDWEAFQQAVSEMLDVLPKPFEGYCRLDEMVKADRERQETGA